MNDLGRHLNQRRPGKPRWTRGVSTSEGSFFAAPIICTRLGSRKSCQQILSPRGFEFAERAFIAGALTQLGIWSASGRYGTHFGKLRLSRSEINTLNVLYSFRAFFCFSDSDQKILNFRTVQKMSVSKALFLVTLAAIHREISGC